MRIQDLNGKKVCIVGYGREGAAMFQGIEKYAPDAKVTVADLSPNAFKELSDENRRTSLTSGYTLQSGEKTMFRKFDSFDVIIKSPGVPPSTLPTGQWPLTSSTQIFFDTIKGSGATVIGITGSKGKSTTASLLYAILKAAKKDVFLIGNIGEPAIAHLADAKKGTIFVFEMSSYQLMDLTVSPDIAVLTSFFPEHLDYHGSLQNYTDAKSTITKYQSKDSVVYFNQSNDLCRSIANLSKGKKIEFSAMNAPLSIEQTKLKGTHNLSNIAAAFKVATEQCEVSKDVAIDAIKNFTPLKHRLESIATNDGIEWINDSISTTPESAIAALDALGDRVKTIILGGQDRGYDFSKLGKRLKDSSVKVAILLPDSGKTIGEKIKKAGATLTLVAVSNMAEAVKTAKETSKPVNPQTNKPPIVLLSPASPSYGHFKNFEDRGNQFHSYVTK